MNHLTPGELVDAVEETLGPDRHAHLLECAACGREIARLRAALHAAREVVAPEPSPLFWDHFSARVHDAIANDVAPRARWVPGWLRWPVLTPIAAMALLMFVVISAIPREAIAPTHVSVVESPDIVADLGSVGEQDWALVAQIIGPVDLDAAREAGIVQFGDAERAALSLNAAERRELLRLLQEEMQKAGG